MAPITTSSQHFYWRQRQWTPVLLTGTLTIASASAFAVDYYVDFGAGSNHMLCGDVGDPCLTIGYTVSNRVSSGDDIYLVGTTAFQVRGVTIDKNLIFHGLGAGTTFLDAGGSERHFRIESGATVRFQEMTLEEGGIAGNCGGSIHVVDGHLQVDRVVFNNNEADCGGAVALDAGTMLSEDSEYTNNRAEVYDGGAINCRNHFSGPSCSGLEILDSLFSGNTAHQQGGAIYTDATTDISRSEFFENIASYGGAIHSQIYEQGLLEVHGTQFTANEGQFGGAISIGDGDVDIRRSSFVENSAGVGGAIYGYWTGPEEDDLTVTNSTFSANSADTAGGISGSGSLHFVTMVNSSANAGQAQDLSGTFDIYRSLITHETAGVGEAECVGTFGGESNLIDTTSCGSSLTFRQGAHNNTELLPLRRRGGRTLSHGLESGSVAVGTANNCDGPNGVISFDQRGAPRPGAGADCDIGSFERQ